MHLKGRIDHATGTWAPGNGPKKTPLQWVQDLFAIHPEYDGVRVACETGTFRGDGPLWFAEFFTRFYSVELNPGLYRLALQRCDQSPSRSRMWLECGDSANVVPTWCDLIGQPVLWLLDAHWCKWTKDGEPAPEPGTASPLWAELAAIRERPYADIVLVDDAANFGQAIKGADWQAVTFASVAEALGRVVDKREYQNSGVFWRTAIDLSQA